MFGKKYDLAKYCPSAFSRFVSGHSPLPKLLPKEHPVVTFFREPAIRIASGFMCGFHDCAALGKNAYKVSACEISTELFKNQTLLELILFDYTQCVSGCMTNMLIGYPCGYGSSKLKITDLYKAVERVDACAFFGITGYWNESILLWKAMYGGNLPSAVMKNTRPVTNYSLEERVLATLMKLGLTDPFDNIVYKYALSVFAQRRHIFKV
jgi:hypothetical protein